MPLEVIAAFRKYGIAGELCPTAKRSRGKLRDTLMIGSQRSQ